MSTLLLPFIFILVCVGVITAILMMARAREAKERQDLADQDQVHVREVERTLEAHGFPPAKMLISQDATRVLALSTDGQRILRVHVSWPDAGGAPTFDAHDAVPSQLVAARTHVTTVPTGQAPGTAHTLDVIRMELHVEFDEVEDPVLIIPRCTSRVVYGSKEWRVVHDELATWEGRLRTLKRADDRRNEVVRELDRVAVMASRGDLTLEQAKARQTKLKASLRAPHAAG